MKYLKLFEQFVRIGFATIENPQERILNFINDLINI